MTTALFDEAVRAAVRDARHAPSSHNSQPWQSVIVPSADTASADTASIVVALDPARCLSALPAHRIEMLVSAGAYIESLVVALDAGGISATLAWTAGDDGGDAIAARAPGLEPVALLTLRRASGAVSESALRRRALLTIRRTHRGAYRMDPVQPSALASLASATSLAFPAARDLCAIDVFTEPEMRAAVSELFREHGALEFTHAAAWAETYAHIRFGDPAAAGDGIPIEALLAKIVPRWQKRLIAAALSPTSMRALAPLGLARAIAGAIAQNIATSPLLVYVRFRAEDPSPVTCLAGGALMQSAWLSLAEYGLALHPLSVLLQHDPLRALLDTRIGRTGGRGFFLARAGSPRGASSPAAPRRAFE